MLQNPPKTLGFKKNMVYKIPPGGGKPYPASGLLILRPMSSKSNQLVSVSKQCIYANLVNTDPLVQKTELINGRFYSFIGW